MGAEPGFPIPDLPRDLSGMDDRELMALFSEYTSWQNYAATKLTEAEIEEERAEAALKLVEATEMVLSPTGTVTVAKAQITVLPQVQAARDRVLDAYAMRKMTGVIYANCERCAALISRELSRRIGREGPERRQNRWNP